MGFRFQDWVFGRAFKVVDNQLGFSRVLARAGPLPPNLTSHADLNSHTAAKKETAVGAFAFLGADFWGFFFSLRPFLSFFFGAREAKD